MSRAQQSCHACTCAEFEIWREPEARHWQAVCINCGEAQKAIVEERPRRARDKPAKPDRPKGKPGRKPAPRPRPWEIEGISERGWYKRIARAKALAAKGSAVE